MQPALPGAEIAGKWKEERKRLLLPFRSGQKKKIHDDSLRQVTEQLSQPMVY